MANRHGLLLNQLFATPRAPHVSPHQTTPRSAPVCILKPAICWSMKRQCRPLKRQVELRCRSRESSTRACVLVLTP
eukprot:2647858-Rhodomonas_salina.2